MTENLRGFEMKYNFTINDKKYEVAVGDIEGGIAQVSVNDIPYEVVMDTQTQAVKSSPAPKAAPAAPVKPVPKPAAAPAAAAPKPPVAGGGVITAPIPGLILSVKVSVGDTVKAGQIVATMEAMKMENNLISAVAGTVKEIRVQKGAEVSTGDVVMIIG